MPPGKYTARGYAVGALKVEGVDILGNDWAVDDENLRVLQVEAIALVPEDEGVAAIVEVTVVMSLCVIQAWMVDCCGTNP